MIINNPANNPDVFIIGDNILSPIGQTTAGNVTALQRGISGVKRHPALNTFASVFEPGDLLINKSYTRFENLLISSIKDAIKQSDLKIDNNTALIISSTKGNIGLLETEDPSEDLNKRIALHTSAKLVADYFGFKTQPIVVSNACISGVMGILTAMRLIKSAQYDNVIVAGADGMSEFVLSGFKSFQALSDTPCRPFDKDRSGLNLGEGAATIILSKNKKANSDVKVSSGAISNDANHISGPSRTGEELAFAIKTALLDAGITAHDVGYISAHGTATNYNDEMEANAINLAGLQAVPLNSLKGYYGHTLGAAGLIESVIAVHAVKSGEIFQSIGYSNNGVTHPVNVATGILNIPIKHALKTASGFGGCNAAMIFSK